MSSILSIESANKTRLKDVFKEYLGAALVSVFRQRAAELSSHPTCSPSGLRDKAMMAWLKRCAIKNESSDFFEQLHLDFWSGDGGSIFSANCDHRFEELFLGRQREDFNALVQTWNEINSKRIVEFGCGSGRLVDYLTKELGGVESAVGIDINQVQIEKNKASEDRDSRIDFICTDGGEWLANNGQPSTLFVSNGGVLEYFTRERLESMLSMISGQLKPAIFFSSEPVAADHDWSKSTESIPFGEELSFSHNYTDLFESSGFEIVHQRVVEFDQWKMVCTIAVAE